MSSIKEVTDKSVIFLSCLMLYFSQAGFPVSVAPILVVIIFGGFLSYFDAERLKIPLIAGFILCTFFSPGLVVFLPVIACDLLFISRPYFNFFLLVPFAYYLQSGLHQVMIMVLALLLLAVFLSRRRGVLVALQKKHYQLLDEAREMSLRLQKQNRELMEKQDNELTMATLNERNRIAREIHDNVGHLLSSAILQTGALRTVNRDENIKALLEALHDTLSQAMDSTRSSVHALYDEAIDLRAQVEKLVAQFTFCEIRYEYSFDSNPPLKLKTAFIAIVREALSNLMKHSDATYASVALREHPALYQLIIKDNGRVKNYDPDRGMGLKNMADRVHALQGIINIMTEDGFAIFVTVPKEGMMLEGTDY